MMGVHVEYEGIWELPLWSSFPSEFTDFLDDRTVATERENNPCAGPQTRVRGKQAFLLALASRFSVRRGSNGHTLGRQSPQGKSKT
jgi:hypothetical protein